MCTAGKDEMMCSALYGLPSDDDNKTILIDHWASSLVINGMGINNLCGTASLIFKIAIYS